MTDIAQLEKDLLAAVSAAKDEAALEAVRVAALGKSGSVSALLKTLGSMTPDERKRARDKYKALQKDHPEKKEAVKLKWQEYKELPEGEKSRLKAEAAQKPAKPAPRPAPSKQPVAPKPPIAPSSAPLGVPSDQSAAR